MGTVLASVEGREPEPVDDVIDRLRRLVEELHAIPNINASISISVRVMIGDDHEAGV